MSREMVVRVLPRPDGRAMVALVDRTWSGRGYAERLRTPLLTTREPLPRAPEGAQPVAWAVYAALADVLGVQLG